MVDGTVSTAWTGLCYDSRFLLKKYIHLIGRDGLETDDQRAHRIAVGIKNVVTSHSKETEMVF